MLTRPQIVLLPAISILLYPLVYVYAAILYPGGSNFNQNSIGYQFQLNYWCELLAPVAKNGSPNPAQYIAMGGMIMLSLGLALLWWWLPAMLSLNNTGKRLVQISGIASMILVNFIFTQWHDAIINISGALGLIALSGLMLSLYRNKNSSMLIGSVICLLSFAANNYIYHTNNYIEALPAVQKISFALVLGWLLALNILLYKTINKPHP